MTIADFTGATPVSTSKAQALALLAFRLCLVPLFYYSGIGKIMNFAGTAARLPGGGNAFSMLLTAGSIGVEVGIATLFLFGIFARQTAVILILYTIAATLMFHNFWAVPEAQVVTQTINFCKNLGLIGGLLMIVAVGAGPYAIGLGDSSKSRT